MYDIIYVCNSTNNKNVRQGELNILRKHPTNKLCFEFGESEMNIKRRFYDDVETMEKDFVALEKLAKKEKQELKKQEEEKEDFKESVILQEEEKPEEIRERLRTERRRRMYDR